MTVVFWVLTSCSLVCSNSLEECTASICEIAVLEQVDAEDVGGSTLSLLRQWEHFNHFLKPRQQLFPIRGLFWPTKSLKNVCSQLNWRDVSSQNLPAKCIPAWWTNQPTPWSKILLEKLTVTQPVKRSLSCYGTQSLNTVRTATCPCPCPCPELEESSLHLPNLFM